MIEVEWNSDCPTSGLIEVDPTDYSGMTQSEVLGALYLECLRSARANASCYVIQIDRVVKEIMEAAHDCD